MVDLPEFLSILIHGAAYRFGLAIELTIEAISEANSDGMAVINLDHYAAVYYGRTNCDDELNPFISDHWRGIDTTLAMDRYLEERKQTQTRPRKRKS